MNTAKTLRITLSAEQKTAFFTAWIVGLFAYAYRFFNFLPTWDSMYGFESIGAT